MGTTFHPLLVILTTLSGLQDIDAAYMMDGDGDLDADLSALLEVPDLNSTDLASLGPSMTPAALAGSFDQGAQRPFRSNQHHDCSRHASGYDDAQVGYLCWWARLLAGLGCECFCKWSLEGMHGASCF